jgi:hypothetical protein
VKPLSKQVLRVFRDMDRNLLDLHVLFESAGNEPLKRERVIDAVDELLREGMIESKGSDFYGLTAKGKVALDEA